MSPAALQRSCPRKEQHARGSAQDVLSSKGEFRISWESCSLVSITNWAGTAAGGNRRMFCSSSVVGAGMQSSTARKPRGLLREQSATLLQGRAGLCWSRSRAKGTHI